MSQKNETLPLILALVITIIILAGGFWWLQRSGTLANLTGGGQQNNPGSQTSDPGSTPTANNFPPPSDVAAGTTIRIDGSTSMAQINTALKSQFEQQFGGASVILQAQGSSIGLQRVAAGEIDIAAVSRALTPEEESQGLQAVTVRPDAIAIIVGIDNPFNGTLTTEQVRGIFTGQITNWQEIGGPNATIRVINRPPVSGTHQAFQDIVLDGQPFGNAPNITTMPRDETTGMIQQLGTDGIGYATYVQVANQSTARSLLVDGINPRANNYPLQRQLAYVYQEPASDEVAAFLGFVGSPAGQQAVNNTP
ncbi:MAG: phosphate ABC transporter substrate-binding protein [Spirulinaceae cyanobacterium SM2_1_0]|nr:phosphate ABC transporter substrate-binding protein [Spirulinaceae cyanobacterium SM2_1_0]